MNVLIVDDQINVVSGVKFGVHWEKVGVSQIYKAYNAYEAKMILKEKEVDIMLCDIEMPVENGLSLFSWTKEQGIGVEVIFLTAHADFLYAKEAMALGSFDYILQPARYEEIEEAIRRASEKIRLKKQVDENSQYGQFLRKKKGIVLNAILGDLFSEKDSEVQDAVKNLEELDIHLGETARICLIHMVRWGKDLAEWDMTLLYDTVANVMDELFYPYAQKTLLYQKLGDLYYLLIYGSEGAAIHEESLGMQLERFCSIFTDFFDSTPAVYYSCMHSDVLPAETVRMLRDADGDNVQQKPGVYREQASLPDSWEQEEHFCENWEKMLENEMYDAVVQDAQESLNRLSIENRLNAKNLRRFYQKVMGLIYQTAGKLNIPMDDFFADDETLQRALKAYLYSEDTIWLVKYLTARFHEIRHAESGKETLIDEIFQYIRSHINEDIKRDDIADAVHLNANYVSAVFKNKTGVSLKEYIISEKMALARKMVRETKLPISVIAMKVGYTNFSHFSQSYKKINGVSPTEDREELHS